MVQKTGASQAETLQDDYLGLFRAAGPVHQVVGEASAFYLYSDDAVAQIKTHFPGSKLLVMLRNPVAVFPSLHRELLRVHVETELAPERAWHLQYDRASGKHLPASCRYPKMLQYRDFLAFGSQLARLFDTYPRELVHTEVFDDFRADPQATYERILAFLEVESDGRIDFPKVNERSRIRFPSLHRALNVRRLPPAVRKMGKVVGAHHAYGWLHTHVIATKDKTKRPLRSQFRRELVTTMKSEIELLEQLLERDLSHWYRAPKQRAT